MWLLMQLTCEVPLLRKNSNRLWRANSAGADCFVFRNQRVHLKLPFCTLMQCLTQCVQFSFLWLLLLKQTKKIVSIGYDLKTITSLTLNGIKRQCSLYNEFFVETLHTRKNIYCTVHVLHYFMKGIRGRDCQQAKVPPVMVFPDFCYSSRTEILHSYS